MLYVENGRTLCWGESKWARNGGKELSSSGGAYHAFFCALLPEIPYSFSTLFSSYYLLSFLLLFLFAVLMQRGYWS